MDWMSQIAKTFGGDQSEWNSGSVTIMGIVFAFASAFAGDVSKWEIA